MKKETPEQVRQFVEAATANAKEAWGEDDIIAKDVMHVERQDVEGAGGDRERWVVSDNYERFFSTIYTYYPATDRWATRTMYAGDGEKQYHFEGCMASATCLFTG